MAGEWARSLDVEVREAQLEGEAAEISRTYFQSINQSINQSSPLVVQFVQVAFILLVSVYGCHSLLLPSQCSSRSGKHCYMACAQSNAGISPRLARVWFTRAVTPLLLRAAAVMIAGMCCRDTEYLKALCHESQAARRLRKSVKQQPGRKWCMIN